MSSLPRVLLRQPRAEDRDEFLAAVRRSRALHHPWLQPPATADRYDAFLRGLAQPSRATFFVCLRETGDLAGVVNLSEIVHGAFQSAYLSYYAFLPHAGRGFLSEGLALVLRHAFRDLRLHRLEANIQPENRASIALVARLGFRKEGYSPRYLKINGRWRDHERWTVLREDWRVTPRPFC
jgi:ribosomal-protein-alanine N-acetyltransferase